MSRRAGSRNTDYAERRLALARALRQELVSDGGVRRSMRELAARTGTTVTTLRHYFSDRRGMVEAVMQATRVDGAPHLASAAIPSCSDVRRSLRDFLGGVHVAWVQHQVGPMLASMLAEGISTRALGPAYVTDLLEPLLASGEELLRRHVSAGRLPEMDVRQANLMLLSPVVLALLHQHSLDGVKCRPLKLAPFLDAQVDAFLRAFGPGESSARSSRRRARVQ